MLRDNRYISIGFNEADFKGRRGELSLLLEVSGFLSTSKDIKDFLTKAVAKVVGYFGFMAGRIYLLDEEKKVLELCAHFGMKAAGLERVHISEGFSGKAVRTKSFLAMHVSDLENPERRQLLLGKGFEVIVCVPLIAMDEVVGVMNLAAGDSFGLNQDKIDLLWAIANQIATAVNHARLRGDLEQMITQLERKQHTIEFFAYSVSHDLKSPATAIYALTSRLMEKYGCQLDEKGRIHCEQIRKASRQLLDLVETINSYISSKEAPFHFESVDLEEIFRSITAEFLPMLGKRRIVRAGGAPLPSIVGDRIALTRVFRNLVDNALKYGGPMMAQIKIGHQEDDSCHTLAFSDNGVGICEKDQQKIFDVFQRKETSKGIAGSGLGLAIVREVTERHGGGVWLVSGEGQGATFYVSISKDLSLGPQAASDPRTSINSDCEQVNLR